MQSPSESVSATTSAESSKPIFVASVMKSGTWLLRDILTRLTGLKYHEPDIPDGDPCFGDPDRITFPDKHYFSWHSTITEEVAERLRNESARSIFLVRNIFDLTVSLHNHFLRDIDNDTGHRTGLSDYLSKLDVDEQYALIINGFNDGPYRWMGMLPIIQQINGMLEFAKHSSVLLISYERLIQDKAHQISRIAEYLDTPLVHSQQQDIVESTSFTRMKSAAASSGKGVGHFNQGKFGSHAQSLKEWHRAMIRHLINEHTPGLPLLADSLQVSEIIDDITKPLEFRLMPSVPTPHQEIPRDAIRRRAAERALAPFLDTALGTPFKSRAYSLPYLAKGLLLRVESTTPTQSLYIYGLNAVAEPFIELCLKNNIKVLGIIDGKKSNHVESWNDIPVYSPERLNVLNPDTVVITALTQSAQDQIHRVLRDSVPNAKLFFVHENDGLLAYSCNLGIKEPPSINNLDSVWISDIKHKIRQLEANKILSIKEMIDNSSRPVVLFLAERVYFNQLRFATALRKKGWMTVAIVLNPDTKNHQSLHFDLTVTTTLNALLDSLHQLKPAVIHTQGWMTRYELPVLFDIYKNDTVPQVVEFMDVASFFSPDERLDRMLPAMRIAWGDDYPTRHRAQLECERYLLSYTDGVIFCGGKGHQQHLLPPEKQNDSKYLNFPSYPLENFFAKELLIDIPQNDEPWKFVFIGGIPPFAEHNPPEIYADAQILSVLEILLKSNVVISVRNNPLISSQGQLNTTYPEYIALATRESGLKFLAGLFPEELSDAVSDNHFGLMLYDYTDTLVGDLHFSTIIPSKFFTYLEAGLPVLVNSRFHAVCELVETYNCGLVIDPDEYASITEKLSTINYQKLRRGALNARKQLSLDTQIARLINLYTDIQTSTKSAT